MILFSRFSSCYHRYHVKLVLYPFFSHWVHIILTYRLSMIQLPNWIEFDLLNLMMTSNKHNLINSNNWLIYLMLLKLLLINWWVSNEFDQIDEVKVYWSTWLVCLLILPTMFLWCILFLMWIFSHRISDLFIYFLFFSKKKFFSFLLFSFLSLFWELFS